MNILRDDFSSFHGETVLTIGKFDGLHVGHQALIRTVREEANALGVHAALLTFDPHPLAVLRPEAAPPLITPLPEKTRLLAHYGLDLMAILTFTRELAQTRALDFLARIEHGLRPRVFVVGPDFAFGYRREGTLDMLRAWAKERGKRVVVIPPVVVDGNRVSGSLVRKKLLAGYVGEAVALLGRAYAITGRVQSGNRRGSRIGIPTANLLPPAGQVVPANGVYVTQVFWNGTAHPAVTNIGVRPTVDGTTRFIETHILDWQGDLYGECIRVAFLERLREERKFPSLDTLIAQIHADIDAARRWFATHTPPTPTLSPSCKNE